MEFIKEQALESKEKVSIEEGLVKQAKIKVLGVGGCGNNIAHWLYNKGVQGAEIYAINTDQQHLNARKADNKILIGKELCNGLGCGGYPKKGKEAAKENSHELKEAVKGGDMVFLCAGMGGGTGTGAAPVIAQMAKDQGAIVIGTVTMPFRIEKARQDKAEWGLKKLRKVCDTVIVVDNERLIEVAGDLPIEKAFAVANELVSTMIKGIVETIAIPSLVNLDFADVKAIMSEAGVSVIGVGESDTERRVEEAVDEALMNPLLDVDYEGATGALIHIQGGNDLTLDEVNKAGEMITENLSPESQVIWGARILEDMKDKMRVMVIVTGVKSPYILGPEQEQRITEKKGKEVSQDLGIKML